MTKVCQTIAIHTNHALEGDQKTLFKHLQRSQERLGIYLYPLHAEIHNLLFLD